MTVEAPQTSQDRITDLRMAQLEAIGNGNENLYNKLEAALQIELATQEQKAPRVSPFLT